MIDERFLTHRYKSSSYAGMACALMVGGLFFWHYITQEIVRMDLLVIVTATAAIKLGFMTWYRFRD